MKLRTLIVDDETLSRQKIRNFLEDYPEYEIVGECSDGEQALAAIHARDPQVIFLDVEMPGVHGFGVLNSLPDKCTPAVIFVTAFDKYAVQAFETRAFDYLLKPFSKLRFAEAVNRVRERYSPMKAPDRRRELTAALDEIRVRRLNYERIVVRSKSRIVVLKTNTIEWAEAQGDYVKLHVGKDTHMLRETMGMMMKRLDPGRFARIHRSSIVNLDCVRELRPLWGGDYTVLMRDGTQLTLSRTYRHSLEAKLQGTDDAGTNRPSYWQSS